MDRLRTILPVLALTASRKRVLLLALMAYAAMC